jgi:hypothetical protein
MSVLMSKSQASKSRVAAEERRRAKAGHDDAAFRRDMRIRQLESTLETGIVESFRERLGDDAAELCRVQFEGKLAALRAEGPVGCSCGCSTEDAAR